MPISQSDMEPFKSPEIPASAKALSLVGLHHGVLLGGDIPTFAGSEKSRSKAAWRKGARLNHLTARKRKAKLDDIAEESFPVILEIDGGRNFVILKEKAGESEFLVQFPDSREAPVSRERLAQRYSGTCVYLGPVAEGAEEGPFRRLFRGSRLFPRAQ